MPPVPGPSRRAAPARVDALLRDLGSRLRRASAPEEPPGRSPTGLAGVDLALGGGFLRGGLGEIAGPDGSGRTSLALALLAAATRAGECSAVVDGCDAFDPPSAEAAGVVLERLLWVRAPRTGRALTEGPLRPGRVPDALRAALRSAERLLEARGFGLVLLDLADVRSADALPRSVWPRLVRAAAASRTSLVVVGAQRLAGPFAAPSVELERARARFAEAPLLFEGLDGRLRLVRSRSSPPHREATLRLSAGAEDAPPTDRSGSGSAGPA
jgi:hypothetical protein